MMKIPSSAQFVQNHMAIHIEVMFPIFGQPIIYATIMKLGVQFVQYRAMGSGIAMVDIVGYIYIYVVPLFHSPLRWIRRRKLQTSRLWSNPGVRRHWRATYCDFWIHFHNHSESTEEEREGYFTNRKNITPKFSFNTEHWQRIVHRSIYKMEDWSFTGEIHVHWKPSNLS